MQQAQIIKRQDGDIDTPAIIDEIQKDPLDNLAEAMMHGDKRNLAALERLINTVLNKNKLNTPHEAILRDKELANAAAFIGYYVIKTGFDYWCDDYTWDDVNTAQAMGSKE